MTKQQAADFLGVKPRTLELYTQQGKLSVSYAKGTRGKVAQFDEEELERLKQELAGDTTYPNRPMLANPDASIAGLQTIQRANILDLLATAISERIETKPSKHPTVSPESKLTLSLAEAAALAGLSRNFLLDAIHNKKLKAAKRGRGWNIKRGDLESYVRKL